MLYFALLAALHLLLTLDGIHSEKPPKVVGSYYAIGEFLTIKKSEQGGENRQIYFEESYDNMTHQRAALYMVNGLSLLVQEDILEKKSFLFQDFGTKCNEIQNDDWRLINFEPHLKQFDNEKGEITLPIQQLLLLQDKSQVDKFSNIKYRGIPARMWKYDLTTDTAGEEGQIEAYWAIDKSWDTPSKYHTVPLGFKITRKDSVTSINIFSFQHDLVDSKLFEPVRGVFCEGRVKDLYPFPESVKELLVFSYSMEVVLPESITSVDTWIDLQNGLMRTDYDPYGRSYDADFHTFTEIVSFKQGVKYEISKDVDEDCLVDAITPNADMQILFDYSNSNKWRMETGSFFDLEKTIYFYVGDIKEGGIPCKLYHGMRSDFPYGSTDFKTLWEWCIADKLNGTDTVFPVVSLNIYFKEVNRNTVNVTKPLVESGSKLTYHFYNVQHFFEFSNLPSAVYDIEYCFSAEDKTDKRLIVPVIDRDRPGIRNLVHDVEFVQKWYNVLLKHANLTMTSLRLTNLRLRIRETDPLEVYFTVLNRHYDLPDDVSASEPPLSNVISNLEDAVTNDELQISEIIQGNTVHLVATNIEDVDRLRNLADKPRLWSPASTSNKVNSLTKTDPIAVELKSEIQTLHIPNSKPINDGWTLAVVLGVGAIMLVSGVGLGIFSGAGGIVLKKKYRYSPSSTD